MERRRERKREKSKKRETEIEIYKRKSTSLFEQKWTSICYCRTQRTCRELGSHISAKWESRKREKKQRKDNGLGWDGNDCF